MASQIIGDADKMILVLRRKTDPNVDPDYNPAFPFRYESLLNGTEELYAHIKVRAWSANFKRTYES